MRDLTLEECLSEVTVLLAALSASESLLLRRLQQLRREMEASRSDQSPVSPLSESLPFDALRRREAVDATLAREVPPTQRSALGGPYLPTASPAYDSGPPQWAPHSQENWPSTSGENATATSTARSYDYFAELDEKLAVLQQSGREG